MISIIDSGKLVNTDVSPMVPRSCEMVGLSTDTKPTGVSVGNGWSFIEMDTGKVFFYNAEDEEWLEFAGSGGGGQGGNNVLIVNIDPATFTLDKTWAEIDAADVAVAILVEEGVEKARQFITSTWVENGTYGVNTDAVTTVFQYQADSADGYPVYSGGGD